MLRRRLRTLYKLAEGGSFRLLVDAGDAEELDRRLIAANKLVSRDLHELSALDEELDELGRDRARRGEELTRSEALDEARSTAMSAPPGSRLGLEARRGQLPRPVPGPITTGFSRVRVGDARSATALELPRRSVEMASTAHEPARAIAAGIVRWVGELEGLGHAVLIEHGEHYVTVTGRLERCLVAMGAPVEAGAVLGTAAGGSISFALSEGRTALDPSGWLLAPGATPATTPIKAASLRR